MRTVGTKAFGLRTPIIRESDDLSSIVCQSLKDAIEHEKLRLNDGDIVGVTEAVLARSQGNYASLDQIAADVRSRLGGAHIGVVFPILSRNRFSMLLKAIALGAEKVTLQLSYPADEVGNELVSWEEVDDKNLNPYSDCLSVADFRKHFGESRPHRFTGVDYVDYYKSLAGNIDIILCNDPRRILEHTDCVIAADIHTRARTKRKLEGAGAKKVCTLDELLRVPVNGSGYNDLYGLLGSNMASQDKVKLFPRDSEAFALKLQKAILELTGKKLEVLVYGDGGFKDPVGGIWELADPVISPGHTPGLRGTPNELKLKYLADNDFAGLSGDDARKEIERAIREKDRNLMGKMAAEGTTPRQLTDLLGSLCDLMSGSGDKGTPVILIQGYLDNYAMQ
ncbi:MAG: coenzyme F420-0:L-glutamate ligase [Spirochaetes bacterium]|nr:coenzyme F420-0:L-glutamate ligase [Spirochaetota bacterium]